MVVAQLDRGQPDRPRPDRRVILAVFLGGALGSLLRVWLARTFTVGVATWPWAIFAINVSGSFALGALVVYLRERTLSSVYWRPLLGTGLCGAYTTFSTMQLEIVQMVDHDRLGLAVGYALGSVAAGLLAIALATALVRRPGALA